MEDTTSSWDDDILDSSEAVDDLLDDLLASKTLQDDDDDVNCDADVPKGAVYDTATEGGGGVASQKHTEVQDTDEEIVFNDQPMAAQEVGPTGVRSSHGVDGNIKDYFDRIEMSRDLIDQELAATASINTTSSIITSTCSIEAGRKKGRDENIINGSYFERNDWPRPNPAQAVVSGTNGRLLQQQEGEFQDSFSDAGTDATVSTKQREDDVVLNPLAYLKVRSSPARRRSMSKNEIGETLDPSVGIVNDYDPEQNDDPHCESRLPLFPSSSLAITKVVDGTTLPPRPPSNLHSIRSNHQEATRESTHIPLTQQDLVLSRDELEVPRETYEVPVGTNAIDQARMAVTSTRSAPRIDETRHHYHEGLHEVGNSSYALNRPIRDLGDLTLAQSDDVLRNMLRGGDYEPPPGANNARVNGVTVPNPPKFHELSYRPKAKSTEELQLEEMEYFKAHPFKANKAPVHTEPGWVGISMVEKRKPTKPKPFKFATDQLVHRYSPETRESAQSSADYRPFKARPAPKFLYMAEARDSPNSSPRSSPDYKPFKARRAQKFSYSPEAKKSPLSATAYKPFKARAAPKFRDVLIEVRERGTRDVSKITTDHRPFKARPTPKFADVLVEMRAHAITRNSAHENDNKKSPRFRARPVPKSTYVPSISPKCTVQSQKDRVNLAKQRLQEKLAEAMSALNVPSPTTLEDRRPFSLQSVARHEEYQRHFAEKQKQIEEERIQQMEFKARPVPLTSPSSSSPESRGSGHTNRTGSPASKIEFRPFSLLSLVRHEEYQRAFVEKQKKGAEERIRLMEFKARPIRSPSSQDSVRTGRSSLGTRKSEEESESKSSPDRGSSLSLDQKPFSLRSLIRHEEYQKAFADKKRENQQLEEMERKRLAEFKATPVRYNAVDVRRTMSNGSGSPYSPDSFVGGRSFLSTTESDSSPQIISVKRHETFEKERARRGAVDNNYFVTDESELIPGFEVSLEQGQSQDLDNNKMEGEGDADVDIEFDSLWIEVEEALLAQLNVHETCS